MVASKGLSPWSPSPRGAVPAHPVPVHPPQRGCPRGVGPPAPFASARLIALPKPFEGAGENLAAGIADAVARILAEEVLVVIALGLKDLGHAVIGFDPVMHAVAHDVRVVVVAVADGHVEADGLGLALRNEGLVEIPRAARDLGIERPLLVDERAGEGEHAAEPLRVIPSHDQCGGTTGTRAHGGAAVRVGREFHPVILFDEREHLVLDVFGKEAGHSVIFPAAFVALGVTATIGDLDHDQGRDALLGDKVVEDRCRIHVRLAQTWSVVRDEQRGGGAGNVLSRDVDRDGALVIDIMNIDDKGLGVLWVRRAEDIAGDAGIEALRSLRIDLELLDLALRHGQVGLRLGDGDVVRTDEVVAVGKRLLAIEADKGRRTGGVKGARGRLRAVHLLDDGSSGFGRVSGSEHGQRGEQQEGEEGEGGFHGKLIGNCFFDRVGKRLRFKGSVENAQILSTKHSRIRFAKSTPDTSTLASF